jgi:hypothetical protein
MTNDKSFFLYLHNDMSGDPAWHKLGKGMTPYSVVRARQKYCSQRFTLTQLWFGYPTHIHYLEEAFKKRFYKQSGEFVNKFAAQTEMFQMSKADIIREVNKIIVDNKLQVGLVTLDQPYSASNSTNCPFKIPPEKRSYDHLWNIVQTQYGGANPVPSINANNLFSEFFDMVKYPHE